LLLGRSRAHRHRFNMLGLLSTPALAAAAIVTPPGDSSLPAMTAAAPNSLVAPGLLFILAVAAAIGVILLLPSRREAQLRKIGAAVLTAAVLILAIVLGKSASGAGVGVYFWIFAAIAIVGAIRVVTHPKPVYSALYFVLTVMASAGLFVLMWAEFMAAALILIYGGAILVTYVFVIMLAAEAAPGEGSKMHEQLTEHDAVSREPVIASAVGFALLGILLFVIFDRSSEIRREDASGAAAMTAAAKVAPTTAPAVASTGFHPVGGTQALGEFLFRHQLVNLELAGLILTVAMVGAIVIARKRVVGWQPVEQIEMVSTPATPIDDNPHSIPVTGTENPRQKEYPET
jgi:NADH-quinone oxidoreductase subunit J